MEIIIYVFLMALIVTIIIISRITTSLSHCLYLLRRTSSSFSLLIKLPSTNVLTLYSIWKTDG